MEWIPIEIKLPNPSQYCWVKEGNKIAQAVWFNDFFYFRGKLTHPTYWKPMFEDESIKLKQNKLEKI